MCRSVFFVFLLLNTLQLFQATRLKFAEKNISKRALQKSHEKTKEEKWRDSFVSRETFNQQDSLVDLINKVSEEYLVGCSSLILYDNSVDSVTISRLLGSFPATFLHGKILSNYTIQQKSLLQTNTVCTNFILFLKDVMKCKDVIGEKNGKVVIIAGSSQWRVSEFLASDAAQDFDKLLVVVKSDKAITGKKESPYILYTHQLFTDALGSSQPRVLTSWILNKFTRKVNLFPKKIVTGFSGHRFIISVANQPPYVIKQALNENEQRDYDGREIRLLNILAKVYNFSTDFREASDDKFLGSANAVAKTIQNNKANMGIAGLYISFDRLYNYGIFQWHSQDCASFISLTSTAIPKYRAIMGPFHWTVWLAITFTYLGAILIFELSDKMTLKHLFRNPEKLENMFWYVFGTFTNCFTFSGKASWSKAENTATKQLVGFFWLFTIIITACYTGSIIAFITIPVFPEVIDTINQLLAGRYQVGLLDKNGWETWFKNVSDIESTKLLKEAEFVPNINLGLKNVTKAFFWPYAFLASREHLNFIVKTNFTTTRKRSLLHISDQCFAFFNIGILFPKKSIYADVISEGILRVVQSGLMIKVKNDVEWANMRSATGKLLAANARTGGIRTLNYEDRALNLDDTSGMFLLLAMGFAMGGTAILFEIFGGCFNMFKNKKRPSTSSTLKSNPRSHERQTPRDAFDFYNLRRRSGVDKLHFEHTLEKHHYDESQAVIQNHVAESSTDISDSEMDYNDEINKIFDSVFGEENTLDDNANNNADEILEANHIPANSSAIESRNIVTSRSASLKSN